MFWVMVSVLHVDQVRCQSRECVKTDKSSSKASALKLNCAFILIPVLRNFLSYLRGTWINNFLPIDKNIVFHKYIGRIGVFHLFTSIISTITLLKTTSGWAIMFWTLIHTLSHYVNFVRISVANPTDVPALVARGLS